jgi:tetratricopeptide (TPR) repeat protein
MLVVQAELVDVAKESQVWGEHFNRKLSDVFSVQEEIASEIAKRLVPSLSGQDKRRLTRRDTENPDAYRSYLKGRFYWNKRNEEALKKGIEYFEKAQKEDPGYALAYVGLADSYNVLGFWSHLSPKEAFPKAKAAATKALQIDDGLAEAHASLGYVADYFEWDWAAAERAFRRAIALKPGYATAHHFYSVHLLTLQRWDEALREAWQALELDPLSLIINSNLGWNYYLARDYERAREQFLKTLEMDSTFFPTHLYLGWVYERQGLFEEAIRAL